MVVLEEGACLYDALGVGKEASQAEIRKAYLRLAVTCHPDKHPGDEQAKERFQTLQKVYGVLSDAEKRKVYDATGSIDDAEQLSGEAFNELYQHYRGIYAKVTEDDIDKFEAEFRGSAEEGEEVLRYYRQFQGDMDKAFEWIMCSYPERDSHRFMDLIDTAIKERRVKAFKRYTVWAKKVASLPRPSDPLAPPKKSKRQRQDEQALVALIRNKQKSAFAGTLDAIAAKYGVSAGGKEPVCPSEEEFAAAAARLEARKAGGKAGGSGKRQQKKPKTKG